MWSTSALGAWFTAIAWCSRGVVRCLHKSGISSFGPGFISSLRGGLVFAGGFALRFAGSPIPCCAGDLIPWFSRKLVLEIGRELLARPFCQQLLRAYGSPSKAPAGALSLPGLSVPPSFRLRVGRNLT